MRMRTVVAVLFVAVSLSVAATAHADHYYMEGGDPVRVEKDQPWAPGPAIGAAAINVVYVPVRFSWSVVGVVTSGLAGLLTGGNQTAAEDVWGLFRGSAQVTPAMLRGREPFRYGPWESGR